jgi:hypothetical protein
MTENFCQLPSTGGITGVLIGAFFVVVGVVLVIMVRRSRVRLSIIAALPVLALVAVQAPATTDPCAPATTVVPAPDSTDAATTTTDVTPTSERIDDFEETTVPPTTSPVTDAPTTAPTTAPASTVAPTTTAAPTTTLVS